MDEQSKHSQTLDPPANGHEHAHQGKGKGKAKENEIGVVERLQASGKLALNAVTSPQPLPGLADASKAAGSSGGSSGYNSYRTHIAEPQGAQSGREPSVSDTFRGVPSGTAEASHAFENFQHHHQLQSPGSATLGVTSLSHAKQEDLDGRAVVDILANPDDDSDWYAAVEEQDERLTPQAVASLRDALFGSGRETHMLTGLLNFSPEFFEHSEAESCLELQQYFGTADASAARQIWAQQWAGVLSSYTDEVWGCLGSLVPDAKREIEQLKKPAVDSSIPSNTVAVDRLRQILTHVRGHV